MLFVIVQCKHHAYTSSNYKDTNREEEPKEPLSIMTEITTITCIIHKLSSVHRQI